jgi:hypothetical protein
MKFKLTRTECSAFGQFGVLTDEAGKFVAHTLEHAYPVIDEYCPKVPTGVYTCLLGQHQLSTGPAFPAYELQNVPNHGGILLHPGNTQTDSHGCILLGLDRGEISHVPAVLRSRDAFNGFMGICNEAKSITLEVVDA